MYKLRKKNQHSPQLRYLVMWVGQRRRYCKVIEIKYHLGALRCLYLLFQTWQFLNNLLKKKTNL